MAPLDPNKLQSDLDALKRKYFDMLADAEKREKELLETEGFLRRSLSRMSLLAEGLDTEVDAQLERLRDAIRANQSSYSLAGLVERIMESAAIEQRRMLQQALGPDLLVGLLDKIALDATQRKSAAALKERLKDKQAARNIDDIVSALAQLINSRQSQESAPAADKGDAGLLGKLFGKRGAEPGATAQATDHTGKMLARLLDLIAPTIGQPDALGTLRNRLDGARDTRELNALLPELARLFKPTGASPNTGNGLNTDDTGSPPEEVLLQLLERLTLPPELQPELTQIQQRLQEGLTESDLPPVIEAIAELIAKAQGLSRAEKAELEDFLQQITQYLTELDSNLQGADELRIQAQEHGEQFDRDVSAQVKGIEDSVHAATELAQLKGAIQARLTTLRQHLSAFRQGESQRNHAMEQQLASLKEQLGSLEIEANHLREHLQQQHEKAMFDPLTGVHNRLAYEEHLENEFARWKRYQHDLTLAVWDIDRFKSINDTYGHQAGDKVLKGAAQILQTHLRESDFLARYGGEEFVTLMPETALEPALQACEKLRKLVEASQFHYHDRSVPVTISCGLARFRPGDTPERVFERADKALYQAKESGRNRCQTESDAG